MIYNLIKKFMIVSALSLITVLSLIFIFIAVMNNKQVNISADILADKLSANDGMFLVEKNIRSEDHKAGSSPFEMQPRYVSQETPFSTRFFTIWTDSSGNIKKEDLSKISSVSSLQAQAYAKEVINSDKERGWKSDYRYKVNNTTEGKMIIFVDASMNRMMSRNFLFTVAFVLLAAGLVVFLMILIFSDKAVKPVAESYEKQKQFITNANHELKTPLALIMANLDIVETETGKNEWLEDIRYESERMNKLVNQLVELTRMDEDIPKFSMNKFDLSDVLLDTISEFKMFAEENKKHIHSEIKKPAEYTGDEEAIRRVICILIDNAIKYCDEDGDINIKLEKKKNLILTFENSYAEIDNIELEKLFERFYRSDKARTYNRGFGVGLSIAKTIVQQHKGNIYAYKNRENIGFKITLK